MKGGVSILSLINLFSHPGQSVDKAALRTLLFLPGTDSRFAYRVRNQWGGRMDKSRPRFSIVREMAWFAELKQRLRSVPKSYDCSNKYILSPWLQK